MRGLEDYPAVPGTPPPHEKKDKALTNLENELNHERSYVETLGKENREIETIISNLDKELHYIRGSFPQTIDDGVIRADNEHWFKYQAQQEVNKKLQKERKHLEGEIKQIEEQGVVNLDSLTQSELILYVKQLERTTTDLTSELRAAEWSLDKQAKESHHLEQIRGQLDAEIRHYDEELAMFRYYNKTSCPSATSRAPLHSKTLRNDVSFSSLDEVTSRRRHVSPTPGFQRHSLKGGISESQRVIDPKKGPINKKQAAGSLPSLKNSAPAIVVTDASGSKTTSKQSKKIQESLLDMPQVNQLLELQSERNFENSPPPRPSSAGFSFEEDIVRAPTSEISKTGQVTVRLNGNRTLTIQVVVQEEQAECSTCRKLKH